MVEAEGHSDMGQDQVGGLHALRSWQRRVALPVITGWDGKGLDQ